MHNPSSITIPPHEAPERIAAMPALRMIDVRTAGEFETVHIDGSHNVPLDGLHALAGDLVNLDAPILLVCQSGQRSRQAEQLLQSAGISGLLVLDGGIAAWLGAGHPVNRGKERISLERQVRIVAGALAATGGVLALLVSPWFALLPAVVGTGLVYAGVSNTCMMATVLGRLPYNRAGVNLTTVRRALLGEGGIA